MAESECENAALGLTYYQNFKAHERGARRRQAASEGPWGGLPRAWLKEVAYVRLQKFLNFVWRLASVRLGVGVVVFVRGCRVVARRWRVGQCGHW